MGELERRIYRRQIKTTLTKDQEKIFDAMCKAKGIRESDLAREAIIEKLENVFCDDAIAETKEREAYQKVKGAFNHLLEDYEKLFMKTV
ncbi:MAG: hypothetical protein ACTHM7_05915 [Ginsengibacter sp.]